MVIALGVAAVGGCHRRKPAPAPAPRTAAAPPVKPARASIPQRKPMDALADGETYVYENGVARREKIEAARAAGYLDVNLGDRWAPYILQDGEGPDAKINAYRETFAKLANEELNADGDAPRPGEHNYLEVFGIPPSLSVLAARAKATVVPAYEDCVDAVDRQGLEQWTGDVIYLDRDRARREYDQATQDAAWLDKSIAALAASTAGDSPNPIPLARDKAIAEVRADPKLRGRVDRFTRGQARVRAVRAMQARMLCEGLLTARSRYTDGMYDLPSHEALATWERKHDIFGWGFLGGETLGMLLRPPRALALEAFKRLLAERVADAAGIVEDGSINALRKKNPPTWKDADGVAQPVPNLIEDYVNAMLVAIGVATPEDMVAFLRAHMTPLPLLHIAFKAPPLPAYYTPDEDATEMDLSAQIDRGDIWYDFPFDARGKPIVQRRDHYPHLTLFVNWHGQKIPLVKWRTTIGSWRSEMHADGHVYYKYKNSDIGPRVWRQIVATPVWIPPDGTPAKDLLKTKVLDRKVGPVTVVNTDVMGPGYQSAYGLVMGIHIDPKRGGFDNQIRTHGSVDYTSIARRFSHGCHRLVNNRAVRLFDFVLRHHRFRRIGDVPLNLKKRFEVEGEPYRYALTTRGYYYELAHPIEIEVLEGKIMGEVKKPITAYVRKPGVDYEDANMGVGDAAASTAISAPGRGPEPGP
ncbi:MAG TPA: L,D-transpeptidase [Polyangia bacterium]|nr:L,D-transpeptidase [Polyangia bacterium]